MTLEQYLEKKYSISSLKSNLYRIKRFTDYCQGGALRNHPVDDFSERASLSRGAEKATYQEVLAYISYLRKSENLHPKTLKHYLYGLKIYFNYLLETGQRKDHPCRDLHLKDKTNKEIQVDRLYSQESLESFYENYQGKANRNKIILGLLVYQGLTTREITALEVEDLDLKKGEIYIQGSSNKNSKSPKSRLLILQAKQVLPIYNYLEKERKSYLSKSKESSQYLFLNSLGERLKPSNVNQIINENRPKSERIQAMRIRQSVIANLLKKENDSRLVQVFAGHRLVSTTLQYKQTELEQLKNAVNLYHPIQ